MFLHEKIDVLRESGHISKLPPYISSNLNPNFELRPYQKEAFENFITYFEGGTCPKPTQVLFHMATGSGKTLIMAGLMLYLYKKGYRNFLFFVNLSNIVKKTKENFLNASSTKFLFAQELTIDGERVRINQVENFQYTDEDAINICFTTTQGLHSDMWMAKENGMTLDDFDGKKVVMISDEAHHLNVDTKNKRSEAEDMVYHSWEWTAKSIFNQSRDNILLEFTATCDLNNPSIRAEYENKIIFDYPLSKFYDDKYSKDILTLRSDVTAMEKALQALLVSQYRLKVFQENHLSAKPVVLFKSAKIKDSEDFMAEFIDVVKRLTPQRLRALCERAADGGVLKMAYNYFKKNDISFEALATELRDEFSEEHCVSVNDETDMEEKQILLNTLEDSNNQYRAIFEVKKLDEGWDVLNLFDIVRLYETRQSGRVKLSPTTISEAQLIGRGARYYPFKLEEEQPKFQRKYDSDVGNELRVCETLYYHCQNDSRYITELKSALREIGLDTEKIVQKKYALKESFKSDPIYKEGLIFLNERKEVSRETVRSLSPKVREGMYKFTAKTGATVSDKIMDDHYLKQDDAPVNLRTTHKSIREIAAVNYAIVNKVLMKYPIYKFSTLKSYFPSLSSTREFIEDDNYLGQVKIEVQSKDAEPTMATLYSAVFYVLGKIATEISGIEKTYCGTKEFYQKRISAVFTDKIVNYTAPHGGGVGVSQSDISVDEEWRIDLSKANWFAHTDNFGTSEEKAFVAYLKGYIDELRKEYSKIFLVRNERQVHIYSFDDGERFEPDFILFLQRKRADGFEQFQVFIEPKGSLLLEKDAWKQKFLLQLKEKSIPVRMFKDDNDYRIWGFRFFNQDPTLKKEFNKDFSSLLGSNTVEYDSKKDSTILIYSSKKQIGVKAKAAEDEEAAPYGPDDKTDDPSKVD